MTQKERSLLTIKSILLEPCERIKDSELSHVIEKIDACLSLIRPEVLLSEKERKTYDKLVKELRRKGQII